MIQSQLFDLGAAIATPQHNSTDEKISYVKFPTKYTLQLEEWIDDLDASLPPLKTFVIPVSLLIYMSRHYMTLIYYYSQED